MASFEYNPFADSVTLVYKCPRCGHQNTEGIAVPSPDWCAESHSDSINSDIVQLQCEKCEAEFDVMLGTGIYGGEGDISEIDELISYTENIPGEDDDYYDKQLYDQTHTDIDKLLEASAVLTDDVKPMLNKLLYANAITMMETYLGDTLKREVMMNEQTIRKFVETYKPYKKEGLKLSEFFCMRDTLAQHVRRTLNELMYHNLPKIKQIYKEALNVELGDIGELVKAVKIRHDIVHRNGEDKEGHNHNINEDHVKKLQKEVQKLIEYVNAQLMSQKLSSMIDATETQSFEVEFPFE